MQRWWMVLAGVLLFGPTGMAEAWTWPWENAPAQNTVVAEVKVSNADDEIKEAFEHGRSDFWVQSQGVVVKVLREDDQGLRHQKFILRLSNGHSILIAHDIDIAPKIEGLEAGDTVGFYGKYEWNNKGGVVHWTHHDPSGRQPGGWLSCRGRRYQ